MDFKAEHTSKIDASVIWQTQVGTRENCGVAHVESKQIVLKSLSVDQVGYFLIRSNIRDCSSEKVWFQSNILSVVRIQVRL